MSGRPRRNVSLRSGSLGLLLAAVSTATVSAQGTLRLEQERLLCVVLELTVSQATEISRGSVALVYDATHFEVHGIEVVPTAVAPTVDGCPRDDGCPPPAVECTDAEADDRGLAIRFEYPDGTTLVPGTHDIAEICFVPVGDVDVGTCSLLRFVDCLSDARGTVETSVFNGAGSELELALSDGEVCVRAEEEGFRRGDANGDGRIDLTDAVFTLNFLFLGTDRPGCVDAGDADDDGDVNLTDAVSLLNFLFLGAPPPPAPFAFCGADPSADEIGCEVFDCRQAPELELIAPRNVVFACAETTEIPLEWRALGDFAPDPSDWIGLFACGAFNRQYIDYVHNQQSATEGMIEFPIRRALPAGCYEFRYLPRNGFVDVARSAPFQADAPVTQPVPTLSAPSGVVGGCSVSICWEVASGAECTAEEDWIAVYAEGEEDPTRYVSGSDSWQYTAGASRGCLRLSIPKSLPSGRYFARYLLNNSYEVAAASALFEYEAGSAAPQVALSAEPDDVAPGEEICVRFVLTERDECADPRDWVGMFACEAPNEGFLRCCWSPTDGETEGRLCFPAPSEPGCYDFRYLLRNGFDDVGVRASFTVRAAAE